MKLFTLKLRFALLPILPLIAVSSLLACSPSPLPSSVGLKGQASIASQVPANKPLAQIVSELKAKGESVTVVDVGNGKQTSASISMKIIVANNSNQLSTAVSVGGTANNVSTDITAFNVSLIDSASVPSGVLTTAFGPFPVAASLTALAQTIVFTNVTTSTNKFYVAVEAVGASGNITNLAAPATVGGQKVYVSTTGGTSDTGGVAVGASPSYAILLADNAQLQVSLTLRDALGASIDSKTTVTNGSTSPAGTVTAS